MKGYQQNKSINNNKTKTNRGKFIHMQQEEEKYSYRPFVCYFNCACDYAPDNCVLNFTVVCVFVSVIFNEFLSKLEIIQTN